MGTERSSKRSLPGAVDCPKLSSFRYNPASANSSVMVREDVGGPETNVELLDFTFITTSTLS